MGIPSSFPPIVDGVSSELVTIRDAQMIRIENEQQAAAANMQQNGHAEAVCLDLGEAETAPPAYPFVSGFLKGLGGMLMSTGASIYSSSEQVTVLPSTEELQPLKDKVVQVGLSIGEGVCLVGNHTVGALSKIARAASSWFAQEEEAGDSERLQSSTASNLDYERIYREVSHRLKGKELRSAAPALISAEDSSFFESLRQLRDLRLSLQSDLHYRGYALEGPLSDWTTIDGLGGATQLDYFYGHSVDVQKKKVEEELQHIFALLEFVRDQITRPRDGASTPFSVGASSAPVSPIGPVRTRALNDTTLDASTHFVNLSFEDSTGDREINNILNRVDGRL